MPQKVAVTRDSTQGKEVFERVRDENDEGNILVVFTERQFTWMPYI